MSNDNNNDNNTDYYDDDELANYSSTMYHFGWQNMAKMCVQLNYCPLQ